jgi:hypothetical protein
MGEVLRSRRWWGGPRSGAPAVAVVAVLAVLAACGDTEDRSLCPVYQDFRDARAEVAAVDPTAETAADLTDIADRYLATVRQLREVADGRFTDAIDTLDAEVADVERTLAGVDPDARYATWAPLIDDSIADAGDAADRVEELIGPQCTPEADE